jgi:hypothetical protein
MEMTQYLLTDECINQMWYTYIRGYYLALNRKEVLTCAVPWVELKDII